MAANRYVSDRRKRQTPRWLRLIKRIPIGRCGLNGRFGYVIDDMKRHIVCLHNGRMNVESAFYKI